MTSTRTFKNTGGNTWLWPVPGHLKILEVIPDYDQYQDR